MFLPQISLEETAAYKGIHSIGKVEGKVEGKIEGEINLLKKLHTQGLLSDDVFQIQLFPLEKKLEEILREQKESSS